MITLFLLFIIGFFIVSIISFEFSLYEKIGFSFPLGLGLNSILMYIFHIFGIIISITSINIVLIFISIALISIFYVNKNTSKLFLFDRMDIPQFTFSWFLSAGLMIYFLYGIGAKNFYYPPAEYDSLTGYDLMAKMIAYEGKLITSIFDYPFEKTYDVVRFIYPPYTTASFAVAYMAGFENSKVVIYLLFLSFILAFYGLIRKRINDTWAIFFTLLMMITPEMFSHAALALTNLPNAILTSISVISILFYFTERNKNYFYISLIFMVLSNWSRSESIVYVLALAPLFLIDFIKTKEWKKAFMYLFFSVIPVLVWTNFVKSSINVDSSQYFIKSIFWDSEKFSTTFGKALTIILGNGFYYGITFYVCIVIIALNTVDIVTKQIPLAIFILVGWFGYTLMYYQMDNSIAGNIDAYIIASYKRGMFNFVPLCWFFIATSPVSVKWINKANALIFK